MEDFNKKLLEDFNRQLLATISELESENDLLREQLKELKDDIEGLYNNMIALETIYKKEMEEVEN